MTIVVAAFYHFFDFRHFAENRSEILAVLKEKNIKGSILIAPEGINGTVSGTRRDIDALVSYLKTHIVKGTFEHKESFYTTSPFKRAKVRLKKETISLGESLSPNNVGTYVEPQDWNTLITDPEMVVIDARNRYETHIGTFDGALDPDTKNFKELPQFVKKTLDPAKHKKIAAYCTGGIRCEKFTAWLKSQGFEQVYHLKGGILKYLETIPEAESKWRGECYVFDERVAVGHGLAPSSTATACPACGHALTPSDRNHTTYSEGQHCRFCIQGHAKNS
jgi:UPF0176 protein